MTSKLEGPLQGERALVHLISKGTAMTESHVDPEPASTDGARLVVERRPSEAIAIGHEIEIVLLEVTADHVRLGVSAPDGVSIVRTELGPNR